MYLENLTFPERRISKGWYRARISVVHLEINDGAFSAIDEDAFNDDGLADMESLFLKHHKYFILSPLAFDGFTALQIMSVNVAEYNGDMTVLHSSAILFPIRRSIRMLALSGGLAESIASIFSAQKFSMLFLLHISNQKNLHTLSYRDFITFPVLYTLMITNCGVRVIMPNAFDYVGVTLTNLQLIGNELKTLPIGIFNVFIEWHINMFDKVLLIHDNPWSCDCALIETENIVFHILSHKQDKNMPEAPTNDCTRMHPIHCPEIEALSPGRICLSKDRERYFFPRFRLKIDREYLNLNITATVPRKYRLLFIDLTRTVQFQGKKSKCPTINWLDESAKCFKFNNQTESIPFHGIDQIHSKHQMIVLNHIAYRRKFTFWPFHSLIYGRGDDDDGDKRMGLMLFSLAALVGAIVGISSAVVYACNQSHVSRIYEAEYYLYTIPMETPYDYVYDHMPENDEPETAEYLDLTKGMIECINRTEVSC